MRTRPLKQSPVLEQDKPIQEKSPTLQTPIQEMKTIQSVKDTKSRKQHVKEAFQHGN